MKSNVKWIKNFQSVVDNGRGHQTIMDLPPSKNGDDLGATALEFAAMSLSGCISTIFAVVASKMRLTFIDFKCYKVMSRMNGKGPEEKGPQTGRKLGQCLREEDKDPSKYGVGMGLRRKVGGGSGSGRRSNNSG